MIIIATAIIMLVLVHQKKQVQYLRDKEQLRLTFDKEILESRLEIQEQTLKNVSQELHDNIGQVLSVVKLNINTMDSNAPSKLKEKIDDSRDLVGKAIQDLRDLTRSINTDFIIEMGLVRSVDAELAIIKKTGSYKTRLHIDGDPYRMDSQKELILFRIVQEALHNIIKHAMAKEMSVQMHFNPDMFMLVVSDDGVGIEKSFLEHTDFRGSGLGIRNMHNRAKIIKANMTIERLTDKGTSIKIMLPVSDLTFS